MLPMTTRERLLVGWCTVVAIGLAVTYLISYLRPNRNRLTRFVTRVTDYRYSRVEFVDPPFRTLVLSILFACLAIIGAVMVMLGVKPS